MSIFLIWCRLRNMAMLPLYGEELLDSWMIMEGSKKIYKLEKGKLTNVKCHSILCKKNWNLSDISQQRVVLKTSSLKLRK